MAKESAIEWMQGIKNKAAASAALILLCLLVLFSNYLDREHTENVKSSISTLYEDRLIAEYYILQMTSSFYEIRDQIRTGADDSDRDEKIGELFSAIRKTSNSYHETKFTELETEKADEFLNTLREFELARAEDTPQRLEMANNALALLHELSEIQLNESKEIISHAEGLYRSGKTSSQFVSALIIVILLVLQGLVFASATKGSRPAS